MSNEITYKKAITEIEAIITGIENESQDLDELAQQVKKAAQLLKICKGKLKNTESDLDEALKILHE
ncbi:MAG: exodeoxyribonuclease VII small subunit [Cyclobacteriaceae bacterium]